MSDTFPYLSGSPQLVDREGRETVPMGRWRKAIQDLAQGAATAADIAALLPLEPCAIADLPAPDLALRGFVTDASISTFSDVVIAGGSFALPVYADGFNWRIG